MREERDKGLKLEGRNAIIKNQKADIVSDVLERIAEEKGTIITSVALAYVLHKATYVFPIVGGRKLEHLKGNIEALALELSEKDIEDIEIAVPFEPGFPGGMLCHGLNRNGAQGPDDVFLMKKGGVVDYVEEEKPIRPRKLE